MGRIKRIEAIKQNLSVSRLSKPSSKFKLGDFDIMSFVQVQVETLPHSSLANSWFKKGKGKTTLIAKISIQVRRCFASMCVTACVTACITVLLLEVTASASLAPSVSKYQQHQNHQPQQPQHQNQRHQLQSSASPSILVSAIQHQSKFQNQSTKIANQDHEVHFLISIKIFNFTGSQ